MKYFASLPHDIFAPTEKIEDAKARAAVKAQIEADKKARAAKAAREKAAREGATSIETVAMTGLATGVAAVSPEVCARQMARAFAYYHEAKTRPDKWGALEWRDILSMPI